MKNDIKDLRIFYSSDDNSGDLEPKPILSPDRTEIKEQTVKHEYNPEDSKSDYEKWLGNTPMCLWQDNEGNTITRAQVAKTALGMWNDKFQDYDMKSEFTAFKDVSADTVLYHNYINALWQAGILKGDGNGYFYPDKPCTYGEVIKIFSCLTGWGFYAEELAKENGVNAFPKMYAEVLNELGMFEPDRDFNDTEIKDIFPQLVYTFKRIPTYRKTESGWEIKPSLNYFYLLA